MLHVNQLAGFGAGAAAYVPASMVFNGTDEVLTRTLSTSGASTTIFTYSLWVKPIAYDGGACELFQARNSGGTQFMFCRINADGDRIDLSQDAGTVDWTSTATPLTPDIATGAWEHWVIRYDSTQGTADDRLRFYRNGTLQADTEAGSGAPGASEANILFSNGFIHEIGGWTDVSQFGNFKAAFIEVLEGVSQDASAFAFSDSGTWTRKKYTGSYGTYGFLLDGSTGVLGADLSGNGQTFTGTNMDASNLDTADLPPYTN